MSDTEAAEVLRAVRWAMSSLTWALLIEHEPSLGTEPALHATVDVARKFVTAMFPGVEPGDWAELLVRAADLANRLMDAGTDEATASEMSPEHLASIAARELKGSR